MSFRLYGFGVKGICPQAGSSIKTNDTYLVLNGMGFASEGVSAWSSFELYVDDVKVNTFSLSYTSNNGYYYNTTTHVAGFESSIAQIQKTRTAPSEYYTVTIWNINNGGEGTTHDYELKVAGVTGGFDSSKVDDWTSLLCGQPAISSISIFTGELPNTIKPFFNWYNNGLNQDYNWCGYLIDGGSTYQNKHLYYDNTGGIKRSGPLEGYGNYPSINKGHYYYFNVGHVKDSVDYVSCYGVTYDSRYIQGLTGTALSQTSIRLTWTNFDTHTGNTVQIYSGGTWNTLAELGGTSTTYDVTGLTCWTTHRFRVGAGISGLGMIYNTYPEYVDILTQAPAPPVLTGSTLPHPAIGISGITNTDSCAGITRQNWYLNGVLQTASDDNMISLTGLTLYIPYELKSTWSGETGQETDYSNSYTVILTLETEIISGFTSNGNMVIPTGFTSCKYIIIAGGGGGGGCFTPAGNAGAGGGGAGGLLTATIPCPSAGTYSIVVGSGGAGGTVIPTINGTKGNNSSFNGLTAIGGGYGGYGYGNTPNSAGAGGAGGSGGGGGFGQAVTAAAGAGTSGQGYNGKSSTTSYGGGGGGAGAAATNANGGVGKSVSINEIDYINVSKGGAGYTGTATEIGYGNGGNGGKNVDGSDGSDGAVFIKIFNYTPLAPTGFTGITGCDNVELSWVNNAPNSGYTGIKINQLSGGSWVEIGDVSTGITSFIVTGLTPIETYTFLLIIYDGTYETPSNTITITTLDPTPFNLAVSIYDGAANTTWEINDPPFGTGIRPEIRVAGETFWVSGDTIASSATTYSYTGLFYSTDYEIRLVRLGSEYPSEVLSFSVPDFTAPSGLTITSYSSTRVSMTWVNNETYDNLWIVANGVTTAISSGATGYTLTGLIPNTTYEIYVRSSKIGFYGNSNIVTQQTLGFISAFCDNVNYDYTGSTCGNSTGIIEIVNKLYMELYNFVVTDYLGNSFNFNTDYLSAGYGLCTGLTGNYYRLTATPKSQYFFWYGSSPCQINWIPIEDTDTVLTLDRISIKNGVCGGFGGAKGRIVYQFTDSGSSTGWTFTLWNAEFQKVNTQELTVLTNIVYNCPPNTYYGTLENSDGCTYLIPQTFVDSEKLWTIQGVQRVFLTPWTQDLTYTYYDSTSDDWYVAGLDTQQFASTKISSYSGLTDFWYEIKLVTATMNYQQTLNRGSNGLTYNEAINISIPSADNAKWKELVNVLTQRYVIVFQDNNDNWWTCFYRNGAEVKSYRLSENQYSLSFVHPSIDKMLTSIDYEYVKLNIL